MESLRLKRYKDKKNQKIKKMLSSEEVIDFVKGRIPKLGDIAYIICWCSDYTSISKMKNGKIQINDSLISIDNWLDELCELFNELRIFNRTGEIYLWKPDNNSFKGRYISDPRPPSINDIQIIETGNTNKIELEESFLNGDMQYFFDIDYYIWGNTRIENNKYILWEQNRGFKIQLSNFQQEPNLKLLYTVRNYLDRGKNGIPYFTDARLLEIKKDNGDVL
ncbi:MAG: hypothetical protein GF364_04135 [Candidatus Lokiarchaeota archaeon]|nr:hypothetical protein [Candidatus Lokiarchaeota archaeon]